jgi:hypothetical protein
MLCTLVSASVFCVFPHPVNDAFWQACAGGQRRVAEYLLGKGADINWIPEYAKMTPLDAVGSPGTRRDTFASWLRGLNAKSGGT